MKKRKTSSTEPGLTRGATAKQKTKCWMRLARGEVSMECPGCWVNKINFNVKHGWEASHIRPRALGGSAHEYNLFPLCEECNQNMKTDNMFCHYYTADRMSETLKVLVETMHNVFRIEYPRQFKRYRGQFYQLAQFYYMSQEAGDGGIPAEHPVWKHFLEYDIKLNDRNLVELQNKVNSARELALETRKEWSKLFK